MKTIKVMSIIGIVLFSLLLIAVLATIEIDLEAAAGFGLLGLLYGIALSIVGTVCASKANKDS